jgi:hypothetical protein
VDQHFHRREVEIVSAPPVVVSVPRRTTDLLRVLRRTYQGNSENRTLQGAPAIQSATTPSTAHDLARLASAGPGKAVDAAAYVALAALARLTLAVAAPDGWERDNSSRVGLTRKKDLSWARGSAGGAGSRPAGDVAGGQAAWVLAAWPGLGSGSGMRQRVTSKPRAPSLPTWWAICRRVLAWRS